MAKETVQAVRQAELNAAQLEKDAIQQKEAIISEAVNNAKVMISTMTKEAKDEAEHKLDLANRKGIEMLEAAKTRAESEALLMNQMAQSKEEAAINLILSNVIYDK
jgi:V/A-type H+/Na+-transporting ATPase subunit G/H